MKFKIFSIIGAASLALVLSGCPAASNTNTATNNTNKPAANNSNTTANTTNTANTAANTTSNTTSSSTEGQVIKIDEAGIQMTVPKGFKFSKDGEDTIVQTDDGGVDIRFTVPKDGDYNKIITDAAKEIDSYLDDVKVEDKGSKVDVNGMEATSMSGTAKNKGEEVMWDLTVINAPKKPVLSNIYAEKSSIDKHKEDIGNFLKSVKKQ